MIWGMTTGKKITAKKSKMEFLITSKHPAGISPDSMEILEKPDREEIPAIIDLKLARYTKYDSRTAAQK
ncbi:MAG: hypothetical protein LBK13_13285 [Spirochaetales bacterium]|jgi:hypothetical protein|nr:hypothetical protein [Spirochaetales bacterium]